MPEGEPTQILTATQTQSDTFMHPGQDGAFIALRSHAGGSWTLRAKFPDDQWVDVGTGDVEFTADGICLFDAPRDGFEYRLEGGTAGAVAWLCLNERYQ